MPSSTPIICEILRDLIAELELVEARAVGGGARSQVWNQIKADVLGVPYQRLHAQRIWHVGRALDRRESRRLVR